MYSLVLEYLSVKRDQNDFLIKNENNNDNKNGVLIS